jgi:hypothetical protein
MRVELADEVFTQPHAEPRAVTAVLKLLETFDTGQHDWVIDPLGVDAVAEYLPRHCPPLADVYADMARMASVQTAAYTTPAERDQFVQVTADDLADHSADLCRAAVVVVEDLQNDGRHFLPTLAHVFGAQRVQRALDNGWLEVRHAGGTGRIPAVAEQAVGQFRRLVRVVVFMDSDQEWPGHESSTMKSARKLKALPIEVHVLACREAENYVPNKVLRQVGRKAEAAVKVAALAKLPHQHRRHLDLKKGFPRGVIPAQRAAFGNVAPHVVRDLRQGFGDTVLKTMFDMRLELREDDFVATDPDAADELRTLLALIESRI